jgi:ribonuclease G
MLCEPCSVCHGRGTLKTTVTVCLEIYREIRRTACTYPTNGYLIIASQLVVDCLIDEMASLMMELEAQLDQGIKIQVENSYHQEQFDVILL